MDAQEHQEPEWEVELEDLEELIGEFEEWEASGRKGKFTPKQPQ